LRKNTDKVLMATISDPKKGRIKMFAYHGSHVNHQKAMDFAKHHKLVARKDADGNPLYAKESYLNEAGIFDKPRKEYLKLAKAKLGKGKTRTFEFPNNRLASQFAKDMSNSGIATTELVDSTKVQVQMLPGNKSVGKSGLAKYLKKSRGKELNESVISKLQESYTSKMPVDIDIDGKVLHITPDVTEDVIMLYNGLNENNKEKMLNLLESDIKSFAKIARFAGKRN